MDSARNNNYARGGAVAGGRGRGRGRAQGGRGNYQNQETGGRGQGGGRGNYQNQETGGRGQGGGGRGNYQNQEFGGRGQVGGGGRGNYQNQETGGRGNSQNQGGGRGWNAPQYQPATQQQWAGRPPVQGNQPPPHNAAGYRQPPAPTPAPQQPLVGPAAGRGGTWTGRPWGPSPPTPPAAQPTPPSAGMGRFTFPFYFSNAVRA